MSSFPVLFDRLPWLEPALWTALTVGGAYLLGHLINLIAANRVARWTGGTPHQWDDLLVRALTSRIPLWSVLAGAWLSLGYWPITQRWLQPRQPLEEFGQATCSLRLARPAGV